MDLGDLAIKLHIGVGLIGLIMIAPPSKIFEASETIDHKSKRWRFFYRSMVYFACNFVSFFVSPALIFQWIPTPTLSYHPKLMSAFILLYPTPLALVLYVLHAKFSRWLAR